MPKCSYSPTGDHEFIFTSLKLKPYKNEHDQRIFRNFRNFNEEQFLQDVDKLPWSTITQISDVDICLKILHNFMKIVIDKHAPLSTKRFKRKLPEWLKDRDDILSLMHRRDNLKKEICPLPPLRKFMDRQEQMHALTQMYWLPRHWVVCTS
ncbi:uncharacterized protein LOC117124738 [Anneissia japonica]|uniref:uncharacterized protein LOC117124738 n=1 Tax=Anneissia japonica TaxID=1529436 RepID=UPI0014257329|nr:uncharacterized protein LOC117124738 [Anneissia japonica]